MVAEKPASPRIFRIEYTTPHRGRKPRHAAAWIKVPYGGLFGLSDNLTRAMSTGQIESFRMRVARPGEITPEVREQLARWPEALERTTETTQVEWTR